MKGRLANMTQPGALEFREYEVPEPPPGGLVARVVRSNVCGSELHIWCGHHPNKKSGGLGHEVVGVVDRLGAGTTHDHAGQSLKEGDRVVATYFIHCRRCVPCSKGQPWMCANAYQYWARQPDDAPHFHATFATHWMIHPEQTFFKVPDEVSDKAAASANCALSQVYFGLDQAKVTYGDRVLIQGAGGLGLNCAAVAHEKGAEVIVIDAIPKRLADARRFGAHHVIDINEYPTTEARIEAVNALTGGSGVDVCVEVAGVVDAFAEAPKLIRLGGTLVSIGTINIGQTVPYDPGFLVRRGVTILPTMRYFGHYLNKSMQFLAETRERFPHDELLDADYALDDVAQALSDSAARKVTRASLVV
ncbi:MAG: zinc-binding dehydrogenase [Gammaproteobacteria bacterium]